MSRAKTAAAPERTATRRPATARPSTPTASAPAASGPSDLPAWATRKPDPDGRLPVPSTLRTAITKALGPLARTYAIVSAIGMVAARRPAGRWGLHRQLAVANGAGSDVAQVLDVLAHHALPLTGLDLWYPPAADRSGTAADAATMLAAALASSHVSQLERFHVLLARVAVDAAIVEALANGVARMPGLRELGLNAAGGTGVTAMVEACPPLAALELAHVGLTGKDLGTLAGLAALSSLESLTLRGLEADTAAIGRMLAAPWAARLQSLELARADLTETDYRAVAELPALTRLSLGAADAATLAAIADASFVPQLTRLELRGGVIDARLARRLAGRGLAALQRLDLRRCQITDAALRPLVDAAPSLTELGIPRTTLPKTFARRGRTVL